MLWTWWQRERSCSCVELNPRFLGRSQPLYRLELHQRSETQGRTIEWLRQSQPQAVLAFESSVMKPRIDMKYITVMWSDWQDERQTSITHSRVVTQLAPVFLPSRSPDPCASDKSLTYCAGVSVSKPTTHSTPSRFPSVSTDLWHLWHSLEPCYYKCVSVRLCYIH